MRSNPIICLSVVLFFAYSPIALSAADKPNVKEGLWEVTITHSGSGMPGMPEDALAKMPPDQRARVEEMMKQRGVTMSGNTTVVKSCVTKEKIDKGMAFAAQNRGNCTHSMVNSTATHFEAKFHCEETAKDGTKSTIEGNTSVDLVSADSTKGTTHAVTTSGAKNMTIDTTFTSKYLGAECGDVK